MKRFFLILYFLSLTIIGQAQVRNVAIKKQFDGYIEKGDSIYAAKSSLKSFEQSNVYYDSAYYLALTAHDTIWLFKAVFAKARVYDAWNKEPQKTIAYLQQAIALLTVAKKRQKNEQKITYMGFYLKEQLAHAFEKAKDTANCIKTLNDAFQGLKKLPDSIRTNLDFISEMALVATEVGDFALAEKLLITFTTPSSIVNEPSSYNYKDHYYLSKARIEVFYYKQKHSPYLDSLVQAYKQIQNPSDSIYYCSQLNQLYAATGEYQQAFHFLSQELTLNRRMNDKEGIESMENQLLASELALTHQQNALAEEKYQNRLRAIWGLIMLLVLVAVFGAFMYRKHQLTVHQAQELGRLNQDLIQKNEQNELLRKEIHHRTKNNLQMIFSLLQMQERSLKDEDARKYLQEARFRIESIANLHEQLLDSTDYIDFHKHITKVVHSIMNSLANTHQLITHLDIKQVHLSTENMLPIALILNEWITNSIKYAKIKTAPLEIYIKIYETPDTVCIHYRDTGTPVKVFESGVGSHIVNLFCRQIKAELTTSVENAFDYQLNIPVLLDGK